MPLEFSPNDKTRQIHHLVETLFAQVLRDEEMPFFISDEATVLDVSLAAPLIDNSQTDTSRAHCHSLSRY